MADRPTTRTTGRRAQYARMTDEAIREAARALFTEKGYFETRVEEIARRAEVSPASVYAVGGGKSGLLRSLIDDGVDAARNSSPFTSVADATDADMVVELIVRATTSEYEQWGPLMRQVVAAAAREPAVRESLRVAEQGLRAGLQEAARRLDELDALRADLDVERATDILWMLLCHSAFRVRADDLGWSATMSATWLDRALRELLLLRS